ncbi:RING finger protein 10 [Leucoagaricus sp. SymC.cos]|nr:RING finger protein 10 [Leucoagaricus sp. SymC.cos]
MSNLPTANKPSTPKRTAKMASNQPGNLNHLLNFSLPPRQSRPLSSIPRRGRRTGTTQGVWNKERFVNAQYRFVMNPNGDYTVHFADPDIFFQWSDILQVIIPRSTLLASAAPTGDRPLLGQGDNQTSCPICLAAPTAPRMTKCGHIFCFPCILHYLGTSDNKWARCPICFDSVNERQLKSVKWFDVNIVTFEDVNNALPEVSSSSSSIDNSPRPGTILRMRLIERPQITTLALPRSHTWPSELLPPHQAPFHFLPDVYSFSKFMLATPTYIVSDLTRDLDELASERRLLARMKDDLGLSFVDRAEAKVRQQIANATALNSPILQGQIEKTTKDQHDLEERAAFRERRQRDEQSLQEEIPVEFLAIKSTGTQTPISSAPPESHQVSNSQDSLPRSPAPQPRSHPRHRRNINPPPPTTQSYYYYQAASGLPIYFHPLDIRILLAHFNNYTAFPDTIDVRVEAFSESTIDDDLRKRCKYLAHMPEGADVVFIEADLEGVVGLEGLKNFEGSLKSRTTRRQEKGKKDDRAKAKAEEREREKEKLWTSSAAHAISCSSPISNLTSPPVDDFSTPVASPPQDTGSTESSPPPPPQQQQQASGAWGARSFASALHSPPTHPPSQGQPKNRTNVEEEWNLDVAWHELEQRAGGRKKKSAKLVVLGGGGGRRR